MPHGEFASLRSQRSPNPPRNPYVKSALRPKPIANGCSAFGGLVGGGYGSNVATGPQQHAEEGAVAEDSEFEGNDVERMRLWTQRKRLDEYQSIVENAQSTIAKQEAEREAEREALEEQARLTLCMNGYGKAAAQRKDAADDDDDDVLQYCPSSDADVEMVLGSLRSQAPSEEAC